MRKVGLSLFFLFLTMFLSNFSFSVLHVNVYKVDVNFFFFLLMFGKILSEPYGQAIFFVGKFLITYSISLMCTCVFRFSVFLVLISCVILGICPLHVLFQIYWVKVVNILLIF